MTVAELAALLEERIPASLSEPWDHDGIMILPDGNAAVTRVLCALDCTTEVIRLAKQTGCNVIVTHHPLLFHPLGSVCDSDSVGKRVLACIQNGIAVLSYHTRLDCMEGGVNDRLAMALGLRNVHAFVPFGRVGEVEETSFFDFCDTVIARLQAKNLIRVSSGKPVKRVAVISGCGKGEIAQALQAGADTFVTGEVMHNDLLDCREWGINLICATHHATEKVVLPALAELISECGVPADLLDLDPLSE